MRRDSDDPKAKADSILIEWGGAYPLVIGLGYPGASETGSMEEHQVRVQVSGHSDPTARNYDRYESIMEIDDAARSLPARMFQRLFEHYVTEEYGGRAWRMERDAAQIAFWSVWNDRKKAKRTRASAEQENMPQHVDAGGTTQVGS